MTTATGTINTNRAIRYTKTMRPNFASTNFSKSVIIPILTKVSMKKSLRIPFSTGADEILPYKEYKAAVLDDFTKFYIQNLLQKTEGNISEAARISGLERVSLQKIIRRIGVNAEEFRKK